MKTNLGSCTRKMHPRPVVLHGNTTSAVYSGIHQLSAVCLGCLSRSALCTCAYYFTLRRIFGRLWRQGGRAEPLVRFWKDDEVECGEGGRDESERQRAESQWIVAARPLCHLQYPVAYLSRLQRILPAARWELYFMAARAAHPLRGLANDTCLWGPDGPY